MNRLFNVITLSAILPLCGMARGHQLVSFPPTSITSTSAAVVITYPASTKGVVKGVLITAAKAATAADQVVMTSVVTATLNGQSRTLASIVTTSAVPSSTTLALPVYGEVLALSVTAGGTNSHNQTHTIYPTIIYEE